MAKEQANKMFDFDSLRMYFGDDYDVNDKIHIHQPTIQEIIDWGEKRYYSMVSTITSIPSDNKSFLFDNGVDWEEISDFEYFILVARNFPVSETSIIFGEIDFSKMRPAINEENGLLVLYDEENDIVIDILIYQKMIEYVREMHGIVPMVEKSFNKRTKEALIEWERSQIKENQKRRPKSILLPLISSMLNSAGFKYKKNELREVGIVEFMDSVHRIPLIMSTDALLKGMYSGMIDMKKIDKKEFNWMRELTAVGKTGENIEIKV